MAGSVRNMAPNCSGDRSWWRQRVTGEWQISLLRISIQKPSRNQRNYGDS